MLLSVSDRRGECIYVCFVSVRVSAGENISSGLQEKCREEREIYMYADVDVILIQRTRFVNSEVVTTI